MISFFQAGIMGLLQGVAELFPISSLGHSVILPQLLGWQINQTSNYFLVFLVATHFATALVLFLFFFSDWLLIFKGLGRSLKNRYIDPHDAYEKLGWLIIVSTIPVGLVGVLFQKRVESLLGSALFVSIFLIINGLTLYTAEIFSKQKQQQISLSTDVRITKISWFDAVKVGISQCLALIPGFSRTGSTLSGGLIVGLDHESAVRFSFLLATPVIFAAAILKLPDLSGTDVRVWGPIIFGAICSALGAYFSVRFLTKYFQTKTLTPFAIYCVVMGVFSLIILLIR